MVDQAVCLCHLINRLDLCARLLGLAALDVDGFQEWRFE
jgi:hypothetical protein